MRQLLPLFALFLVLSCSRPGYIQVTGQAQGGNYSVKLNMEGVQVSQETVGDSIAALLVGIDTTLSGYNKASLLSRFNAGEPIRPNALFLEMYGFAYKMWQRSGGAVDCAAGPLFDAWGFGFREGSLPSDEEVSRLKESCGMARLPEPSAWDRATRAVMVVSKSVAVSSRSIPSMVKRMFSTIGTLLFVTMIPLIFCRFLNSNWLDTINFIMTFLSFFVLQK